ncbi:eukaryotic translation initiation factor 4G-like [Salvia divinorum]|uniref:Eukaryotic translation initiation factor 4G-like n=1 Tax=Salvia divinorum TaxID=28513 RepID=A0ABD1G8U5_SALDI
MLSIMVLKSSSQLMSHSDIESSSRISIPHFKPGVRVSSTSAASSRSINVESDVCNTAAPAFVPMVGSASILKRSASKARNKVAVPGSVKDVLTQSRPAGSGWQANTLNLKFDFSILGSRSNVADVLMVSCVNMCESHPSPGRNIDRASGSSRSDRRASGYAAMEMRINGTNFQAHLCYGKEIWVQILDMRKMLLVSTWSSR